MKVLQNSSDMPQTENLQKADMSRQTTTRRVWWHLVPSANSPTGACPNCFAIMIKPFLIKLDWTIICQYLEGCLDHHLVPYFPSPSLEILKAGSMRKWTKTGPMVTIGVVLDQIDI